MFGLGLGLILTPQNTQTCALPFTSITKRAILFAICCLNTFINVHQVASSFSRYGTYVVTVHRHGTGCIQLNGVVIWLAPILLEINSISISSLDKSQLSPAQAGELSFIVAVPLLIMDRCLFGATAPSQKCSHRVCVCVCRYRYWIYWKQNMALYVICIQNMT